MNVTSIDAPRGPMSFHAYRRQPSAGTPSGCNARFANLLPGVSLRSTLG